MAFSSTPITHQFTNPDGTPASGTITFQLSKRITNGGVTIVPGEVTSTLNAQGQLAQSLVPCNDPGTTPTDSEWLVTFRLQYPGATQDGPYAISVPAGASVDLGSLLPGAAQVQ